MAVDTAKKRASVSGIPLLIPGVTPDATPDYNWRYAVGWDYAGIAVPPTYGEVLRWRGSADSTPTWQGTGAHNVSWRGSATPTLAWTGEG